jgi:hypothetical protein
LELGGQAVNFVAAVIATQLVAPTDRELTPSRGNCELLSWLCIVLYAFCGMVYCTCARMQSRAIVRGGVRCVVHEQDRKRRCKMCCTCARMQSGAIVLASYLSYCTYFVVCYAMLLNCNALSPRVFFVLYCAYRVICIVLYCIVWYRIMSYVLYRIVGIVSCRMYCIVLYCVIVSCRMYCIVLYCVGIVSCRMYCIVF